MIAYNTNVEVVLMNNDKVTCAICGKEMKKMTVRHLRTHGIIDFSEYKEQYPSAVFTSDETRNKISRSNMGNKQSPEHIEKLRQINIGRKHTDEAKKKISDAGKGRKHTEKTKKLLSEAHTGKKLSEIHKQKLRGQVRSLEICEKISIATKKALSSPEVRKKLSDNAKGKKHSLETRTKMSATHKGKIRTKEHCDNLSKSLTGKKLSTSHIESLKRGHPRFKGVKSPRFGIQHTEDTRIKISCNQQGIEIEEFKGFLTKKRYCLKFNDNLKNRVRLFFNNVCFLCGKTTLENGKNLSVHHVNYDKMVCCNDVLPLLVPLCHSCHSKTGTNRTNWSEYFEGRLEMEYDGKCFYTKDEYKLMCGDVCEVST